MTGGLGGKKNKWYVTADIYLKLVTEKRLLKIKTICDILNFKSIKNGAKSHNIYLKLKGTNNDVSSF